MATFIFYGSIYWFCAMAYLAFFAYSAKWIMGSRYEEWLDALTDFDISHGKWTVCFTLLIGFILLGLAWPYLVWKLILREWRKARAA